MTDSLRQSVHDNVSTRDLVNALHGMPDILTTVSHVLQDLCFGSDGEQRVAALQRSFQLMKKVQLV